MLRYAEECDYELRGKLGPKLVTAWKRLKKRHDHTALTQFDAVVANLDRWRALRYRRDRRNWYHPNCLHLTAISHATAPLQG